MQGVKRFAWGSGYKEIAADLNIGLETVNTRIRNISARLHVRWRTGAAITYLQSR